MNDFYMRPARYAKNKTAITCPADGHGYKTRAWRLASSLARGRYTNRENAYIMSHAAALRFVRLYADGWDASFMTGKLEAPTPAMLAAAG